MGAGTILLISVAVLIMAIMFKVADGAPGAANVPSVAGRSANAGGEPPLIGAKPDDVDAGATAGRGTHRGRYNRRR